MINRCDYVSTYWQVGYCTGTRHDLSPCEVLTPPTGVEAGAAQEVGESLAGVLPPSTAWVAFRDLAFEEAVSLRAVLCSAAEGACLLALA